VEVIGMSSSTSLTFLGTGNFGATAGYWNAFLIGRRILVETSPAVLRNLQLVGVGLNEIDVIFISHFHADHTFGWPFLLFTWLTHAARTSDAWVVGPPGIGQFLEEMLHAGRLDHLAARARLRPDVFTLHYVEVTGHSQEVGGVTFRAVRVDHDPELDCYGYLIDVDGRTLGYTGDTTLCPGLRQLAANADVLVSECNSHRTKSPVHMTLDDIRTLRSEFPDLPLVLTHHAHDVDGDGIPNVRVPKDLETIEV
jgi:ribonuclease BN (tRNA processing enzyme)